MYLHGKAVSRSKHAPAVRCKWDRIRVGGLDNKQAVLAISTFGILGLASAPAPNPVSACRCRRHLLSAVPCCAVLCCVTEARRKGVGPGTYLPNCLPGVLPSSSSYVSYVVLCSRASALGGLTG